MQLTNHNNCLPCKSERVCMCVCVCACACVCRRLMTSLESSRRARNASQRWANIYQGLFFFWKVCAPVTRVVCKFSEWSLETKSLCHRQFILNNKKLWETAREREQSLVHKLWCLCVALATLAQFWERERDPICKLPLSLTLSLFLSLCFLILLNENWNGNFKQHNAAPFSVT